MSDSALPLALADGRELAVALRRSPRARRLILRIDQTGTVTLVLPAIVRLAEAKAFLAAHQGWVEARMAKIPGRLPLADGAIVPYLGRDHRIRHRPEARGTVWLEEDELHVAGKPEYLERRVADWLKAQAKRELGDEARRRAAALGRPLGRITVRDTRSRWGSCSSKGDLSLCWRLILAPDFVRDYVVAHEVAHLAEMNHGPRFWRLVDQQGVDRKAAQRWLRVNGPRLHRYG
ncbi:MAG: M48 family metallopeptidase [Alphaproteobacteria bacterium]|nr:M48 family metallopeptidase [Alphaproteobacteria bacterium]MBU0798326.1 M48 family metallopeptidase [Alphaproteobacteria bacterium]MBU0887427.1 M48 family metallopeptidase [Alphaproteobacteria bacterium]MBU1813364.1 M48 family metallopeptidase [Alphaproteobacteria bacterium]